MPAASQGYSVVIGGLAGRRIVLLEYKHQRTVVPMHAHS